MNSRFSISLSMVLLAVLFFALVLINNQVFKSVRFDLTEDQVYSLSAGSQSILTQLDEPIHLYFFYSNKASEGITPLRNYASRVQSLLKEYQSASGGKLQLHIVDPEPFSEAEDQAVEFGLTGASLPGSDEAIYFGLAGRNSLDDELNIAFFDPQKERFLEYDISQLIYQLSSPEAVNIGIISGLSMTGGQNPMTGQFDPPWQIYSQLQSLYQPQMLDADSAAIPDEIDVLLLIHPKGLTEATRYAIDQFVLNGGKLVAFVDPHHESTPATAMANPMAGQGVNASELGDLFSQWGIDVNLDEVLLDAANGLELQTQNGIVKHFGIVGIEYNLMDQEDVITASLDVINGASFGSLGLKPDSELTMQPLLFSSEYASLTSATGYARVQDPNELGALMTASTQSYVLAARFSGKASSAFAASPVEEAQSAEANHISEANINVLLVADTDLLVNRLWVSQANFFGQTISTPFADNGALFTNALENLGGSDALIGIRSRGTYARPFVRVQELTVQAEMKFREQEQLLEQQLLVAEQKLSELESQESQDGALVLTPEQESAIDEFNEERIAIRKALREVRHQLDRDIEQLGSLLKFINIAVMPIVLVLILMFIVRWRRQRSANALLLASTSRQQ